MNNKQLDDFITKYLAQYYNQYYIENYHLKSDTWCLGGTSGNCWNNDKLTVNASPAVEFTDFDSLLEKICPQISFLQYKRILQQSCSIEEYGESDYYGGYVRYAYYLCDLKKLFEILTKMNLISDN